MERGYYIMKQTLSSAHSGPSLGFRPRRDQFCNSNQFVEVEILYGGKNAQLVSAIELPNCYMRLQLATRSRKESMSNQWATTVNAG